MYTFINEAKLQNLGGGVKRQILSHAEDMMAVRVIFDEGAVGTMHTHPHSQISYVLKGKFKATLGTEEKIISVGDSYYTEPDLPHGVVCLEAGELLDIFTPERKDFLG